MFLFMIDQYLKEKIEKAPVDSLPQNRWVKVCKTHNYGLCLNHLEKHPEWSKRLSFTCLLGVLFYVFPRYNKWGSALTFFGGLSNFYDRVKRGYVVDYLQFPKISKTVYNLADFEIFAGLLMMLIHEAKRS